MEKFGDSLRKFRERKGLSQRALAKLSNIDTSYISRLERGEREVTSRDLAIKLADLLDLNEDEKDLWLFSAGYVSDRFRLLPASRLARLMAEINDEDE